MTRKEFIAAMRGIGENDQTAADWADYAAESGKSLEQLHAAFYGVHQKYGGEMANLMYLQGPRRYCLYPNEFLLLRQYLDAEGDIGQTRHDYQMRDLPQGQAMCPYQKMGA
jgi:hypothetical protein